MTENTKPSLETKTGPATIYLRVFNADGYEAIAAVEIRHRKGDHFQVVTTDPDCNQTLQADAAIAWAKA